jgi:hypothetical protein
VRRCPFAWRFGIDNGSCKDELVQPQSPLPLIRCWKKCPAVTCQKRVLICLVRRGFEQVCVSTPTRKA